MKQTLIALLLLSAPLSVVADAIERIVVTGSRIDVFDSPAVTLVKPADYLIQKISLSNDSRNDDLRTEELTNTVKGMLRKARHNDNIEIAVGNELVYPLTLEDFQLDMFNDDRPDSSVTYLLIKTPINRQVNVEKQISDLQAFIKNTKKVGRTEIDNQGEVILSIINPQKHRKELLRLIAQDLNDTIQIFGDNYSAEIDGISQSLQWERASVSELRLYLEYNYTLHTQ